MPTSFVQTIKKQLGRLLSYGLTRNFTPFHGSDEFEKWRAIRASVGGVDDVLAWVAWVACLRGWRGWHANVGGELAWVVC